MDSLIDDLIIKIQNEIKDELTSSKEGGLSFSLKNKIKDNAIKKLEKN